MVLLTSKDENGHTVVTLEKDDVLIHEGTNSEGIYFVKEGVLTVSKHKGGKEQHLGNVHSGELVGEMSFLDNEPRCATVRANSPCILIEIPAQKFREVQAAQPKWFQTLVLTLLERLRRTNAKVKI